MKYTVEEIRSRISMNSLGTELIETSFKQIEDPVLSTLWEDVQTLIEEINTYLDEYQEDITDYDEDDD